MKRELSLFAIVFWSLLGAGGGAKAGVVPSDIQSSATNHGSWASAFVSGQNLIPGPINVGISVYGNKDPRPGEVGWFDINVSSEYNLYERGTPISEPRSQSANAQFSTNTVHMEPWGNGEKDGYIILYDQQLSMSGTGNTGYNIDPLGNLWSWMSGNFGVTGGYFTSIQVRVSQNEWTDQNDPRPSWFNDGYISIFASGVITSHDFAVVPEPATLSMMAIGGLATFVRHRRWHNKIA